MQNIIVEDRVYRTKMVKFIIMRLDIHYYSLITIKISVFMIIVKLRNVFQVLIYSYPDQIF